MRKHFETFQRMAQSFREVCHGDYSSVVDHNRQRAKADRDTKITNPSSHDQMLDRTEVSEFAQFRDNGLVKGIKTLGMSTMFGAPEVVFTGLDAEDAAIHNLYLQKRYFGPAPLGCNLHRQAKACQFDALITGVGAVFHAMRNMKHSTGQFEVPVALHVDITRVWWDPLLQPEDSTWVCLELKQRRHFYDDVFGEGWHERATETPLSSTEDTTRVIYYFDTEGEKGTFAAFVSSGNWQTSKNPITIEDGWYSKREQEYEIPCLPVRFLSYLHLPGGAQPVSFVALAFRGQLDAWSAQTQIRDAMELRMLQLIKEDAIHEDDREAALMGDALRVRVANDQNIQEVIYNTGKAAIDELALQVLNRATAEMEAQFGYSANDVGQSIQGAETAREVSTIAARSQSTSSMILAANVEWYSGVIDMLLHQSAIYDVAPVTLRWEGADLEFGENAQYGPIGLYLRPGVEITIREETLRYQGSQAKRDAAIARFQLLVGNPLVNQEKLIQDVLEADGIGNWESYIQETEPQPMDPAADPMAAMMAPGGNVGLPGNEANMPSEFANSGPGLANPR